MCRLGAGVGDMQGEGGQGRALELEAVEQFGREVLGVGRRAAVAAGEDLAVGHQAVGHGFDGRGDGGGHEFEGGQLGLGAVIELLGDAGDEIHEGLR